MDTGIGLCGHASACAPEGESDDGVAESIDIGSTEQALVAVSSFAMLNAYYSTDFVGFCNPLFRREMRGHEPSGSGNYFFGDNAAGVRTQLQAVVGVSCPNSMSCLQADGSAWAIVPANQLADRKAELVGEQGHAVDSAGALRTPKSR